MSGPGTTRRALVRMTIGGAVVAASGLWRAGAVAATRPAVSFGYQATLWGAPAIVAEDLKLFQGLNAEVQMRRFSSGKAVRDAMISGAVDMGSLGATPFIVGVVKGEVLAVAAIAYAGRTLMVVARKDRGIRTVADLKGKKVGSQRGSITDHIFVTKIVPKFGLSKADVQIVNVSFQDQVSALASGSIDAFAGVDPYPGIAEHMGIGVVLTDYGDYDLTPVLLAVNSPVVEKKRGAVVEFLKGWLRSVRIFQEEPDRAAAVVWESFKAQGYDVPREVIRKAVGRLDVTPEFLPQLEPYLTEQARVLREEGQIGEIPDWNRALVRGLLAEARRG